MRCLATGNTGRNMCYLQKITCLKRYDAARQKGA